MIQKLHTVIPPNCLLSFNLTAIIFKKLTIALQLFLKIVFKLKNNTCRADRNHSPIYNIAKDWRGQSIYLSSVNRDTVRIHSRVQLPVGRASQLQLIHVIACHLLIWLAHVISQNERYVRLGSACGVTRLVVRNCVIGTFFLHDDLHRPSIFPLSRFKLSRSI